MINLGIIGTSWITEAFLDGCHLLNNKFKLTAVYSRTLEKGTAFAEKYGCKTVYCNLNDLACDRNVDAIYIASPNAFHYSQSKLMLLNKKHVICEKPITVTPDELLELQTIAKTNDLVYMEAIIGLHLPSWHKMPELIKQLGRISHVRFDFSQRSSKYDGYKLGIHQNIFDPKMATGALMDLGIYCVYPAVSWFGKPSSVFGYCTKLSTGIDGEGGAILGYNDFNVEICYSKTGESRIGSEIIGENGTIIMPSISRLTNMYLIDNNGNKTIITNDTSKSKLMSYEALDFFKYITEPMKYSSILDETLKISLLVSRIMLEIRNQADIKFQL